MGRGSAKASQAGAGLRGHDEIMYHVTKPESAQELISNGYSVDAPYERNSDWSDKAFYLWTTLEAAEEWQALFKRTRPWEERIIVTVDTKDLELNPDQNTDGGIVVLDEEVDPERIRLLEE